MSTILCRVVGGLEWGRKFASRVIAWWCLKTGCWGGAQSWSRVSCPRAPKDRKNATIGHFVNHLGCKDQVAPDERTAPQGKG